MRRTITILGIFLLCPALIRSQLSGRISGNVRDIDLYRPLEGATISVFHHVSGLFIKHAVSGKWGEFTIGGLPLGDSLDLVISFTGYRDTGRTLNIIGSQKVRSIGNLLLRRRGDDLDSVTIKFHRPPFVIHGDTIEFNACAFISLPTDMLQDLLRKIPSMVVDNEGNVKVNGKKVSKIKVDGREFFNGNVKTIMENFPGNVIDKIQVSDTREQGTENNSIIQPIIQEVTLNLTMKKENKKGLFGHANKSAGTLKRYSAGSFLNIINGDQRESFFGNVGNTSVGNIGGMGTEIQEFSGGGGILKNITALGANLNNTIGRKGTIDLSYFTDNIRKFTQTQTDQTNILPDSTFTYNSIIQSKTNNRNHALRVNYVNVIDTLQQLTIAPEITYSDNASNINTAAQSMSTKKILINTQQSHSENRDKTWFINSRASYVLANKNRKSNLNVNWMIGIGNNSSTLSNESNNYFYHTTAMPPQHLDQQSITSGNSISNNLSLNFSRIVNKNFTAILNYTFAQSIVNYNKDTYNYDSLTGKHDVFDSLYSVHSLNTSLTYLPTASIGFHADKFSIEAGVGLRIIQQENKIVWKDSTITINQHNLSPKLTTAYQFARYVKWILNYSINTNAPTTDELAAVPDNTNPLYVKIGNLNLHSAIIKNINTQLQFFSNDYKWHSNIGMNAELSNNQIVNDIYYDSLGRQVITFKNTNGNRQLSANVNGGTQFQINVININLDAGVSLSNQRSNNFINQQRNKTMTRSVTPTMNIGVQYRKCISLQANAAVDCTKTDYFLHGMTNVRYSTTRLMLFLRVIPVKRVVFNSTALYTYNSRLPDSFQRSRTLINASIHYQFLKSEKLSVGVAVNDLLNNNTTLIQTVSPTNIQNTQVDVLKRYTMINVGYRFSNFKGIK